MGSALNLEFNGCFFLCCVRIGGGDVYAETGWGSGGETGFDGVDGFPGEFIDGVYYVV